MSQKEVAPEMGAMSRSEEIDARLRSIGGTDGWSGWAGNPYPGTPSPYEILSNGVPFGPIRQASLRDAYRRLKGGAE